MKAKVLRTFKDGKNKVVRKKGTILEVSDKRFTELNATKNGKLVEEVKGATKK